MSNLEIYQKMLRILLRSKCSYEPKREEPRYDIKFTFWNGIKNVEYFGLCGLLNHVIRNQTTAQRIRAREIFKRFGEILIGKENIIPGRYWIFGHSTVNKPEKSKYFYTLTSRGSYFYTLYSWGSPHIERIERIYYMFRLIEHVVSLEKSTFESQNFSSYAMCACSGNYPKCIFCTGSKQCDICLNRYNIEDLSILSEPYEIKYVCNNCMFITLNY